MVVACPRCGYDQSGVMGSWRESCPLRSVCSECGEGFEWGEAVRGGRRIPWLFEDAPWPWAAWRTWARALYPARFWARVRGHGVRPARLALWLVTMLLSVYLVRGALYTAVCWWTYHRHPAMVSNWQYLPWYGYAWSWPFFGFIVGYGWSPVRWYVWSWPLSIWATSAVSLGWMLVMLIAGGRREALRAWAYSHAWLGVLGLITVGDLAVSLILMAAGHPTGQSATTGFYYHRWFASYWLLQAWPAAPVVVLLCWQGWWWWCAMGRRGRVAWVGGLVLASAGLAVLTWLHGLPRGR